MCNSLITDTQFVKKIINFGKIIWGIRLAHLLLRICQRVLRVLYNWEEMKF